MHQEPKAWIYCRIDAPEDVHGMLKVQRKQLHRILQHLEKRELLVGLLLVEPLLAAPLPVAPLRKSQTQTL